MLVFQLSKDYLGWKFDLERDELVLEMLVWVGCLWNCRVGGVLMELPCGRDNILEM